MVSGRSGKPIKVPQSPTFKNKKSPVSSDPSNNKLIALAKELEEKLIKFKSDAMDSLEEEIKKVARLRKVL